MYERYCQIRDHLHLKDSDVSKMSGIAKSTFSDWKSGRSAPKQQKLEKICKVLNVSPDYLKGRIAFISCPLCGYSYNPLSKLSSDDHTIFHHAFNKAKDNYPFLLNKNEATSVLRECQNDYKENLSDEEKIAIIEKEIIAEFSMDLMKKNYTLGSVNFAYYRLSKLSFILFDNGSLYTHTNLYPSKSSIENLVMDYQEDIISKIMKNKQLLLLFAYMTQLPKSTLNLLEIQIEALVNAEKPNDNVLPKEEQTYDDANFGTSHPKENVGLYNHFLGELLPFGDDF